MKQSRISLRHSEDGVIHHLGIIIFAVVLVGAVSFAIYRIQNNDPNYGYKDGSQLSEAEEDQTQSDLDTASNQADQSTNEADQEVSQTATLTEQNDEN